MAPYLSSVVLGVTFLVAPVNAGAVLIPTDASLELATAPAPTSVTGANVHIVAQWNESKDASGIYQAPEGFVIESATPVVKSELRSSSSVSVSADRREARLNVHVRGKGEFWNKERGWFDGYLAIRLIPKQ